MIRDWCAFADQLKQARKDRELRSRGCGHVEQFEVGSKQEMDLAGCARSKSSEVVTAREGEHRPKGAADEQGAVHRPAKG